METNKQSVKKYSFHIRLWHWLNAVVIAGSLLTVLLNSTVFDVRENASFIKGELAQAAVHVSQEQAIAVSHGLEDKIWDLHIYFGYALAVLFLYRIMYELTVKGSASFVVKLKATFRLYLATKLKSDRHELGIKALYLSFYALLLVMVATGLSIAFDNELGISKSFSHSLKEIHGFCMYLILGFIVLHIMGVFFAERKDKKGIVSDMINGGEVDEETVI
jgi:Ni/Fe-hydrogenase 1 B-type cytochrome subunit